MFYHLFHYLDRAFDVPGAGMFNYISFRTMLSFITALLVATLLGRHIIDFLRRKQIGETIRDLGLDGQMQKKGTPTMGGIIIIIAILAPTLFFANLTNIYIILMLITTLWLGLTGGIDDYIKVFKKNKDGLKGRYKIVGQVGLGLIVGFTMIYSPDIVIRENQEVMNVDQRVAGAEYTRENIKSAQTTIPFVKNNNLHYSAIFKSWSKNATVYGWILFVLVTIFIVTAVSNSSNLTDGIDGLAAGSSAVIGVALGILAYVSGNVNYSGFLNIMYIPGAGELLVFAGAFIGATIGFLWYNAYPAQVFMGDTGSLTIGGIIGVFAILVRKELLLPILCGVFLVESLSVIIQTAYFKITKRKYGTGRRIFKMTPVHHHFQTKGGAVANVFWDKPHEQIPESKITVRFWIIGIILAVLAIITLKIR
ncbi:MAG: phospho-N-acetylmuramoyl-pentapeptide-transferase [Prevotellaceae bacterium]|jgi:phospho-N-acetylmuramoyl-pentapeptide-transferase|nr:phospho-N-acetylmuramoyl-pentapeptide-transferase [Prevotellaceae bacterium]